MEYESDSARQLLSSSWTGSRLSPLERNEMATIRPTIAPTIPPISLKKPTMQPGGFAFNRTPHLGQASAFDADFTPTFLALDHGHGDFSKFLT